MKARDVMTRDVAAATPDTPVRKIAALLLQRGISAMPIVDESGVPVGMVSEGDLVGRGEREREARRDWWLALLAEGTELNADFLAGLRRPEAKAREVMSAPVVTVEEDTDPRDIARLLTRYRIKRVPVVRDGHIVGIVSRADLLRALATPEPRPIQGETVKPGHDLFAWVDRHFHGDRHAEGPSPAMPRPGDGAPVRAENFRSLVRDYEHQEARHQDEARRVAAEQRRQQAKELIDRHVSDDNWRTLLHQARQAAEHGQKELLLLRFPHELLSDGGRAINATEADWPQTLRGEAAEIYLRWERELKPCGFGMAARVLDFPGGMPGDIGLFLVWGE